MKKASLQKQTLFAFIFLFFFTHSSLLLAQNDCKSLIEEVTQQYEAPPDSTEAEICDYTHTIYKNTIDGCPIPKNVKFEINGNFVTITWDLMPSANQYRFDYINTTTGAATYNITIDQPPITLGPLDPGVYLFAIRSVCEDQYSDPVIFHVPINPIIVDVIGFLTGPQLDPICLCPLHDQPPIISTSSSSSNSDFEWLGNYPNCVEKYDLRVQVNEQGVNYNMKAKVVREFVQGVGSFRVAQCNGSHDIQLVQTSQDHILEGRRQGDLLFTIEIDNTKLTLSPSTSITGNSNNYYNMVVRSCCPMIDDDETGGGNQRGNDHGDKELNENNNSNSRSSGFQPNKAMKPQLLSSPNPFDHQSMISYTLPVDSELSLHLYNAVGQLVLELENGFRQAGNYQIALNGEHLQSGIYYLRLKTKMQDGLIKIVKL